MSTKASRSAARLMLAPAVILLLAWMLVPLTMTLIFSFQRFLPLRGGFQGWVGFENYVRFISSSAFWPVASDLTGMAVFLASAEADYIVGQTYNVDGGQWMS